MPRSHPSRPSFRGLRPPPALAAGALLLALVLGACNGEPLPPGERRYTHDSQHRIADPGVIGASATGTGCAVSRRRALTIARRVAQFNLRSLTGAARYNVRFDLVSETSDAQGYCVEFSARAIEPAPYER